MLKKNVGKIALVKSQLIHLIFRTTPFEVLEELPGFYRLKPLKSASDENDRVLRLPKNMILKLVDSVAEFDDLNQSNLAYKEKYLASTAELKDLKNRIIDTLNSKESSHDQS